MQRAFCPTARSVRRSWRAASCGRSARRDALRESEEPRRIDARLDRGHVSGEPTFDRQFVRATLAIQEHDAITRVDRGELVELSAGYRLMIDPTPGVTPAGERYDAVQRALRRNTRRSSTDELATRPATSAETPAPSAESWFGSSSRPRRLAAGRHRIREDTKLSHPERAASLLSALEDLASSRFR